MDHTELVALLHFAADDGGRHHVAALAEIQLLASQDLADAEFRAKTAEVLKAFDQVLDELEAGEQA